jgi:DNA-binding Lrp family transcriptional regulator
MTHAIVLLNVDKDRIHEVAEKVVNLEGISEVYSVGGRYDLVGIIRVQQNEMLEELVAERIRGVQGITQSETLIAFRVYSRHDLEQMFAIGMEEERQDETGSMRNSGFPWHPDSAHSQKTTGGTR